MSRCFRRVISRPAWRIVARRMKYSFISNHIQNHDQSLKNFMPKGQNLVWRGSTTKAEHVLARGPLLDEKRFTLCMQSRNQQKVQDRNLHALFAMRRTLPCGVKDLKGLTLFAMSADWSMPRGNRRGSHWCFPGSTVEGLVIQSRTSLHDNHDRYVPAAADRLAGQVNVGVSRGTGLGAILFSTFCSVTASRFDEYTRRIWVRSTSSIQYIRDTYDIFSSILNKCRPWMHHREVVGQGQSSARVTSATNAISRQASNWDRSFACQVYTWTLLLRALTFFFPTPIRFHILINLQHDLHHYNPRQSNDILQSSQRSVR